MTKPWADGPFPLIQTPPNTTGISKETIKVVNDMCFVHNMFTRGLNAIILQYEQLTNPKDIADFLIYCQTWHEGIHIHHHHEETTLFPGVEEYSGQKGLMEVNVNQHHAFHTGLAAFGDYVYKTKPQDYNIKQFKEILESFTPALTTHLNDEIPSLLSLDKYGGDKLLEKWKELEKVVLSEALDPYRVIPLALGSYDPAFSEEQRTPFPWFVPVLSWVWYARKYKGSWRFSPCTLSGKRKELPFAKEIK